MFNTRITQPIISSENVAVKLLLQDIEFIHSETHTGLEFDNIIIAFVRTRIGFFDILFYQEGELIKQDEYKTAVIKIEKFYEKKFAGITIDNVPVWAMKIS